MTINTNTIQIEFPNDGTIYHIPLRSLAEIRAELICSRNEIEIGSSDWYDEIDIVMKDKEMAMAILKSLDWDHLKDIMIYLGTNEDISDKEEWLEDAIKSADFISV